MNMKNTLKNFDWQAVCGVARLAGRAVMEVYATDFAVEEKPDHSPVTLADKTSQKIIQDSLIALYPKVPILTEEGEHPDYAARKDWPIFWLVDPLDGTKEFVARNGEFTVNIALVEGRSPVFGVIYLPAKDVLYAGGPGLGSSRVVGGGKPEAIRVAKPAPGEALTVLVSRSHPDPKMTDYLARYPNRREVEAGSALKFGLVAEGAAHLYPRFNPTWEWDTAAGQALVQGAGGSFTAMDGGPFLYNKPDLRNGGFVAKSWQD